MLLCKQCGEKPRYEYKNVKSPFCADCLCIAFAELFEEADRDAEQRDEAEQGNFPLPKDSSSEKTQSINQAAEGD